MTGALKEWLDQHGIERVEAMVPDAAGLPRGKVLPVSAFLDAIVTDALRFPSSLFCITVDADFVDYKDVSEVEEDVLLVPDSSTLVPAPLTKVPTAGVICDAIGHDGVPLAYAPRQVLKKLLERYAAEDWHPRLAAELEFFLVQPRRGQDSIPQNQYPAADRGPYGIESVDDHSAFFDDLMAYCEVVSLDVHTLIREAGKGQFELSVAHTDSLSAADQVFHFRSAARRIARRHGLAASFMARPYPADFGSAMHVHQSVEDADGNNLFADDSGNNTALFEHYIGGLQRYSAATLPLLAPYANSYLRIGSDLSAPANTHWGLENRSVGFRVPAGGRKARRVENRIPGADANPYLVFAATLGCGYLGMTEKLAPSKPLSVSAYGRKSRLLPRHLLAALDGLSRCRPLRELLGEEFVEIFVSIKNAEYSAQMKVLSPWELEHLVGNV